MDDKKVAFIKVLVAAAWADGELNPKEIRTLTEYLRRLGITQSEYEVLKPLLDGPLPPAEAHALLEEQLAQLGSRAELGTVLAAVEDLLVADDKLAPTEADFLARLRELMKDPATPQLFVDRLREVWRSAPAVVGAPAGDAASGAPASDASASDASASDASASDASAGVGAEAAPASEEEPSSDEPSEEFYRRRLLEYFRHTLALARAQAGVSVENGVADADLYRAAIWAALLSVVAHADADFCPAEEAELLELLRLDKEVPEPDLRVVVEAYRTASLEQFDLAWLVREFAGIAGDEEHHRLLDCLFLVAAADGKLHEHELLVIREITTRLGFPDDAYTSGLSRCEARMARGWN